jgi:hypothetical protein
VPIIKTPRPKGAVDRRLGCAGVDQMDRRSQISSAPSASLPATREQFGLGAILHHAITPRGRIRRQPVRRSFSLMLKVGLQARRAPRQGRQRRRKDDDEDSLPDEALASSVGSFVSERSREDQALREGLANASFQSQISICTPGLTKSERQIS